MGGKSWTVLILVISLAAALVAAGCGTGQEKPGAVYQDGDFSGVSKDGSVEVILTIKDNVIVNAQIFEYDREGNVKNIETYPVCVGNEREPLLAKAHPAFVSQMVAENTVEIDTFSGATTSADSAREAAKAALEEAKVN